MARLYRNHNHPEQTARDDNNNNNMKSSQTTSAEPSSTIANAIMLPSRKAAIRHARDVVQRAPEMRQKRIDQLSQALQRGALILNSYLLADKLIGIQLNDLPSAA